MKALVRSHPRTTYLVALFTIIVSFFLVHPTVSAHAYIVKSSPTQDARLAEPPQQIQIWFDEPIQATFSSLTVNSDQGIRVDAGDAHIDAADRSLLECTLKPGLGNGTYSVHWRVISADGHPVEGVIPFQVGQAAAAPQAAASTTQYVPSWGTLLVRWLQFASLLAFVGILLFWRWSVPPALRATLWQGGLSRWVWWSWGGLLVACLLNLPLETSVLAGISFTQALSPAEWSNVLLYTSYGPLWIVQLLVLLVLMMAIRFVFASTARAAAGSWVLLVAGLILLVTRSLAGHARSVTPSWLGVILDILHLTAASVWVGGLIGLIWLRIGWQRHTANHDLPYVDLVRRFGVRAMTAVVVLALTGLYASLHQVPTAYALTHTSYGETLLVKLCLVVIMLLLGAAQFLLSRRPTAPETGPGRLWTRLELTAGVLVLLVTAALTNLPTARANPGPVQMKHRLSDHLTEGQLSITPNVVGMDEFSVTLTDSQHRPVTNVQQVTLKLEMTEMDMGVDEIRLQQTKPGVYHAQGMYLTMAGDWNVQLHVLKNDLTSADSMFHIVVGSPEGSE